MAGPNPAQIAAFNANLAKLNAGVPNNSLPPGYSASAISASNPDGRVYSAPASSGGGGGGGRASAPAIDRNAIAQFDQAIGNTNSAIGRLNPQFDQGASQINASYQDALNQLLTGKNQANATYDTNKHQTATDYVSSKNTIGANAGSSLNGLLRLLGSRGAGGSSAATITAPGAVARQATQQRADVSGTYGKNNQALDTNWNNYLTGYNNEVSKVGSQKSQQEQALRGQIENSRASLLQTLAQLSGQRAQAAGGNAVGAAQPYIDQANRALDAAVNYRVSPIAYQTQAYTAPDLSKYTVNPNATPTYNGETQGNDYTSPYLAALLGKKQQTQPA